ncbi:MAG: FAD-dependent monooxygenase [Pseudonocardiales bacterium]
MWNGAGKRLAELANGLTLSDGTTNLTIRRADLYQVLNDEAVRRGVRIEHDKRLVDAERTADGVIARFADGTEAAGSVLIGADGMRSRVRALVDPNAPRPAYVGLVGTGGYAHGVTLPAPPGTFNFVFGKRAFFGYLVVESGEVLWFTNEPQARKPTSAELAAVSPEDSKRRLVELFADDAIPAVEIIRAATDGFGLIPLHAMASPARWHRDRMVLIGDAAHVTSPSSGQGASLAIEDAIVLARCPRDLLMPFFVKRMAKPEAMAWLHAFHIEFDQPIDQELPHDAPAKSDSLPDR